MLFKCEVSVCKYVSGGYPCEGWNVMLSAWEDGEQRSLNELAVGGDETVVSTAQWLSEMYGDEDDPPEALFSDDVWSSLETNEESLDTLLDELSDQGWTIEKPDGE